MKLKPKMRLCDFYRKHFHAANKLDHSLSLRYLRSISRFSDMMGHQSVLSDLTAENVDCFVAYAIENIRAQTAIYEQGCLRRVWNFAHQLGFVSTRPARLAYSVTSPWAAADAPVEQREIKTLLEFYELVYKPSRLRNASNSCRRQYIIQINHFCRFLGRDPTFADLHDETVGQFLASIVEHGSAPATANKARNHILALWRFAANKRYAQWHPEVQRIKEPLRTPKAWLEAELAQLWKALDAVPGNVHGIPANAWWKSLHYVLWFTAERIGAVLQLRCTDLDLDTGWLIVPAQFRKFGLQDKATRVPPEALAVLRAIQEPKRQLLFPQGGCNTWLYTTYRSILLSAGLPTDRKSMFHRMRKSAASHFEAAGGNATALCGHSQRRVTMAYLDPRIATPQQPADLLFTPG